MLLVFSEWKNKFLQSCQTEELKSHKENKIAKENPFTFTQLLLTYWVCYYLFKIFDKHMLVLLLYKVFVHFEATRITALK